MSLKLGNTPIAGISQNTKYNAHHLLDFKWTDCIMSDVSWLRADTFSWQSGGVYVTAYNHLVQDMQGITAETETIGSYTVTFYRATDGHKICLADQETTVANIYSETGIAWYYILDTTNTQFKLPRTKYGFEGLRTNVGDKIDESLPNIKGFVGLHQNMCYGADGAFYPSNNAGWTISGNQIYTTAYAEAYLDASRSSSTYQDNAPVQERATQMYLYFYVGDYSQTAIEQTAGLNAELFNNKVDLNVSNLNAQGMSYIAGLGMPSDTYVDLTLGASGTTYTAPANGYVQISGYSTTVGGFIQLNCNAIDFTYQGTYAGNNYTRNFIPVKKNAIYTVVYSAFVAEAFRFIYAQGSESEAS